MTDPLTALNLPHAARRGAVARVDGAVGGGDHDLSRMRRLEPRDGIERVDEDRHAALATRRDCPARPVNTAARQVLAPSDSRSMTIGTNQAHGE